MRYEIHQNQVMFLNELYFTIEEYGKFFPYCNKTCKQND